MYLTNKKDHLFRLCLFSIGLLPLLLLSACSNISADEPVEEKLPELGWVEQVVIRPPNLVLDAKLDTGADNCSIHAEEIKTFKKDKLPWVRFKVSNRYGGSSKLEREIVRTAKVKTKNGGSQVRPVVKLGICLGDTFEVVECNLVDRSHFIYPALIGRSSLAGNILVNPGKTYTKAPDCLPNS